MQVASKGVQNWESFVLYLLKTCWYCSIAHPHVLLHCGCCKVGTSVHPLQCCESLSRLEISQYCCQLKFYRLGSIVTAVPF